MKPTSPLFTRRDYLRCSAALAAVALAPRVPAADAPRYKAAVIGHTGRGDYGHGLDVIFNDRPNIELVAIADPDEAARAKFATKLKAPRHYADYRELLAKERPQLVSVALRHADQHHAIGLAALRAGAHLYVEKPFTTTLAEADELLAEADKRGLKIVVSHQMRLAPAVVHLKKAVADGRLGELVEIRAFGKQDARAGGEDMMVLGVHLFDLTRLFAGDALWCTARVTQAGRDITKADARTTKDNVGLVAGDEVQAQFTCANGVNVSFTSRAQQRDAAGPWGLELIGSKATAKINANIPPQVFVRTSTPWKADGKTDEWRRLEDDPTKNLPASAQGFPAANAKLVDDWLDAIANQREPICSGRNAAKAVEMVLAVYHAALTGQRVPLPLKVRTHPLAA